MSQMTNGQRLTPTKQPARDAQTQRARQTLLALEVLEEREVPAAAVTISGADALAFVANSTSTVDVSYSANVYTITDNAEVINVTNNGTGTVTGNGTNTITVTNTTSLDFDLNGTGSSLILLSNNNPTTLHDSIGGGDYFQIGSGTAQNINGAVTIGSTVGASTAAIDDQTDSTGRNIDVTSTSVTGITPASIDLTSATLSALPLFAGTGGDTITVNGTNTHTTLQGNTTGDTVDVQATSTGAPLTVGGTGAETVSIGNAGSAQGILAAVSVTNSAAGTAVTVDDSADTTATTATISTAGISAGLAPAAINFSGPGSLTVDGGSGGNTFTVTGTPGNTTLNSGTGNDTVNVQGTTAGKSLTIHGQAGSDTVHIGNTGLLSGIQGGVTVDNAGGTTALTIDDSADATTRTPTITGTQVTGFAPAGVTYANLASLNLMGGSGGDTFTINNAGTNTFPTSTAGGSGNDVFKLLGVSTLGMGGTLDGGGGTNTLDYSGYTGPASVNLISGAGSATGTSGVANIQNVLPSDLTVAVSHTGNFQQGDAADGYTVVVSNIGPASTTGTVTVTVTLPAGLSPTSADSGTINGWTVSYSGQTITATRSDALAASASYPALTLTVSVASDAPGSVTSTATVAGGGEVNTANNSASDPTTITSSTPSTGSTPSAPAIGSSAGTATGNSTGSQITLPGTNGTPGITITPFVGYLGDLRVVTADLTGSGVPDVIVGAGAGAPGGHVKVFDGRTGAELMSFFAFDGFTGGVFVGAADLYGNGIDEILVGADAGAGPNVKVFDSTGQTLLSFYAYDQSFSGGVRVAGYDVDSDGKDEIVTGSGAGTPGDERYFDASGNLLSASLVTQPDSLGGIYVG